MKINIDNIKFLYAYDKVNEKDFYIICNIINYDIKNINVDLNFVKIIKKNLYHDVDEIDYLKIKNYYEYYKY